jgi:hypothetical protein
MKIIVAQQICQNQLIILWLICVTKNFRRRKIFAWIFDWCHKKESKVLIAYNVRQNPLLNISRCRCCSFSTYDYFVRTRVLRCLKLWQENRCICSIYIKNIFWFQSLNAPFVNIKCGFKWIFWSTWSYIIINLSIII